MTIFHCESWTGRFYLTHWLQVLQRSLLRLATRNRQNVICMQELCNNCVILGFFFRMTWIVRNTEDQGDRGSCEGDKDFGRWCHTRFGEGHACIGCSCRCFGKVGQEIHRGGRDLEKHWEIPLLWAGFKGPRVFYEKTSCLSFWWGIHVNAQYLLDISNMEKSQRYTLQKPLHPILGGWSIWPVPIMPIPRWKLMQSHQRR